MFISVVIPTYNRRQYLEECLLSLGNQAYPVAQYEVIVVDDGSTDETRDFLNEFSRNVPFRFRALHQSNRGPSSARNLGVSKASGDLIAFLDDDCIAGEGWLESLSKRFGDEQVAGVGGAIKSITSGTIPSYLNYMGLFSHLIQDGVVYYIITANACYRKAVLQEVGGFNEGIRKPGCEDPILSLRVREHGYVLTYDPDAIVLHQHKRDLSSLLGTFFNYGRGRNILDQVFDGKHLPKRRRYSVMKSIKENGSVKVGGIFLVLWLLSGIAYRMGRLRGY